MNSISLRTLRGQLLREAITLLLFAGLMLQSATAVAPDWWGTRGVLKSGAVPDDFAVLNQGQLKNLVRAAVEEMEDKLYFGAGDQARAMLDAWLAQPNSTADDYAAVTVGQLKAVALPLYQALQDAGMPLPMPWTETTTDDDDYALATIGQAKKVFSFRVPDIYGIGVVDSDGDGFSDAVEIAMGSNPFSASSLPMTVVASSGGGSTGPVNGTSSFADPVLVGESQSLYRWREGYRGEQTKTNRYKKLKWEWDLYYAFPDRNVKGSHVWTYDPTTGYTSDTGDDTSYPYNYFESGAGPWNIQSDTVQVSDNSTLGAPPDKISKVTETLSDPYTQGDLVNGVNADFPAFSNTFTGPPWSGSNPQGRYAKELGDDGVLSADHYGLTKFQYKWQIQPGDTRPVVWAVWFTPAGAQSPSKVTPKYWNPSSGGGGESPVYTIDPLTLTTDGTGSYLLNRINADLDVYGMWDGVKNYDLDDAYEDAVGAFVPVNKDDDDADGTPDFQQSGPSPRMPGGQWTGGRWQGPIFGGNYTDTDLLPIVVRGTNVINNTGLSYRLIIPSGLKVWRDPDRSREVTAADNITAGPETPLFVEGCATGTYTISMDLVGQNNAVAASSVDSIKITVFDWNGPENVPGYSIHQYKASGTPATARWYIPGDGTVASAWGGSDVKIRWPGGPVVGQARLYVNADYTWPLEVNVVQVDIEFASDNSITYDSTPFQNSSPQNNYIKSSLTKAVNAQLKVVKLEGPSIDGKSRGVEKMEIGFMQTGSVRMMEGEFKNASRKRKSSLVDAKAHIDGDGNSPWYNSANNNNSTSFYKMSSGAISNMVFDCSDRPNLPSVDTMKIFAPNATVTKFNLIVDFRLYFAVRTIDAANGADAIYTQRASSFWRFDGSGMIDQSLAWTLSGTGDSGSNKFYEVKSGSAVPDTGGTSLNNLGGSMTWKEESL